MSRGRGAKELRQASDRADGWVEKRRALYQDTIPETLEPSKPSSSKPQVVPQAASSSTRGYTPQAPEALNPPVPAAGCCNLREERDRRTKEKEDAERQAKLGGFGV